jgi:TP53 regulating kinase-like protein
MMKLLKKGAEASLYLSELNGRGVVIKARHPKKYRPEKLDFTIRRYRTLHEPQLIHEAKRAGVSTPVIFVVDVENATITMEFIEGKQVKQILNDLSDQGRENLCIRIGEAIAKLHLNGIVHGDLTTSNMILTDENQLYFIDFGLGDKTLELEAQGVDLHLLKRALQSTHFQFADFCFRSVLKGYTIEAGLAASERVVAKIREIEKRGRYIAERQHGEMGEKRD